MSILSFIGGNAKLLAIVIVYILLAVSAKLEQCLNAEP